MNQERFDIEYEGNRILENTRIDGNLKTDKSVYLDGMIQGNVPHIQYQNVPDS